MIHPTRIRLIYVLEFHLNLLRSDVHRISMEEPSKKIAQLVVKCEHLKINPRDLPAVKKFLKENNSKSYKKYFFIISVIVILILSYCWDYLYRDDCIMEMPPDLSKIFRPPEDCSFCRNVNEIVRVSNIDPDQFEDKYAYSGVPVIVTDATQNWTALEVFDFWYFKDVYMNAKRKRRTLNCQFFPYKSGFKNFYEALNIPSERVNYEPGNDPWYFGWSNCNAEVAETLRKHYGRPYFLPLTSENNAVDWIFMGGPGLGAHMHVDNVRLPSWQAQLRGSKQWSLAPPPECYFVCNFFKTVVKKGEIIVLDTNKWYHQTNVLPGELSITIGAEFD